MSRLSGPPLVWCPLLALLSSPVLASCTSLDGQPSVDECADDYQYVIDRVRLPQDRTAKVLPLFGLDEDPTNGLGALLETLHLLAPSLDAQAAADAALAEGEAVTLLNIRARSLETATAVGSWFFDGGEPAVAPCDPQGEECGRHFAPGTEFTRPDTMDDVELDRMIVGQIVGGTLHAGLGTASVELAFMPGVPRLVLTLELSSSPALLSGGGVGGSCADGLEPAARTPCSPHRSPTAMQWWGVTLPLTAGEPAPGLEEVAQRRQLV
jgi:hypothetical protein